MDSHREYIKELMQKHIAGNATDDEKEILLTALDLYSQDEISAMIGEIEIKIPIFDTSEHTSEKPSFKELYDIIEIPRINRIVYLIKRNWIKSLVIFIFIIAAGLIILKISKSWSI